MPEAVIVDAVRTPIGRAFKGSLASLRPDETLAYVIDEVLERNPGVDPATVEEVIAGCGQPQGLQANNIARIAVLLSDKLGQQTNGSTISRYCSSGLDAIRIAANNVVAGQGDTYIAAGVEFVSRYNGSQEAAHPEDQHERPEGPQRPARRVHRDGPDRRERRRALRRHARAAGRVRPALPGARGGRAAERVLRSRDRARTRQRHRGDQGRRPARLVDAREARTLEPAFKQGGTVTAGNSCPLNDGAAAAIVMSDTKARELGLKPRARIITAATWGNEPEYMGVAPIGAIKKALERAGMSIGDVDVYELNEAFAAQVIPIAEEVGFDYDKLNPHGGAIALGHPFGMTGVRIMTTLLNDLETLDGTIGLETMCVAGGQGEAMIVERVS